MAGVEEQQRVGPAGRNRAIVAEDVLLADIVAIQHLHFQAVLRNRLLEQHLDALAIDSDTLPEVAVGIDDQQGVDLFQLGRRRPPGSVLWRLIRAALALTCRANEQGPQRKEEYQANPVFRGSLHGRLLCLMAHARVGPVVSALVKTSLWVARPRLFGSGFSTQQIVRVWACRRRYHCACNTES